jgi:hypothetical protein
MTDLLDRPTIAPGRPDEVTRPVADIPRESAPTPFRTSAACRVALAMLSGASGLLHLVMVPSHSQLSAIDGWTFAIAGWLQIGLAVLLATRPRRSLLWVTIAVNLAFVGVWAVSRIWGLPYGAHEWHAEAAGFVDLTVVGFEAALVLVAAALILRPTIASGWSDSDFVLASVVPVAVLALTTGALMSPGVANHAGASHDHGTGGEEVATGADGHAHEHGTSGDDLGFSLLANGHQHDSSVVELDAATQAELDGQLAVTRELAERYPTLADAKAAGYTEAGPFSPGLGLHLMPPADRFALGGDGRYDTRAELESPFLIYDGIEPDAPIAGFMYVAYGVQGEPEGFAGPNDHWHFHTNTCVTFQNGKIEAPLGADRSATQEQCDQFGGRLIENTGYMVHVWSVPGYENADGVFSELSRGIDCPDGTYYTIPLDDIGFVRTVCRT